MITFIETHNKVNFNFVSYSLMSQSNINANFNCSSPPNNVLCIFRTFYTRDKNDISSDNKPIIPSFSAA